MVEGYDKWVQNLMILVQVVDCGVEEKVYVLIDWFMGGVYVVEMLVEQGYIIVWFDFGVQYVKEKGWLVDKIVVIEGCEMKFWKKFVKNLFVDFGYFFNVEVYECEIVWFKNV